MVIDPRLVHRTASHRKQLALRAAVEECPCGVSSDGVLLFHGYARNTCVEPIMCQYQFRCAKCSRVVTVTIEGD